MCLAILSPVYFSLDMLGEHIVIDEDAGSIKTCEIYDLFFTPACDIPELSLVCISPHVIFSGSSLSVQLLHTPGAGGPDDSFYLPPIGHGSEFQEMQRIFKIAIQGNDSKNPSVENFAGQVLLPSLEFP